MENYVKIGKTSKAHGVHGELRVAIEEFYIEDFINAEILFLDIKGSKVPYFVESLDHRGKILVKFEDVPSRDEALKITSCDIYMREKDMIPPDQKTAPQDSLAYGQYIGYQIHDNKKGFIGNILNIEEYPQQEMAILKYKAKDIMIPMNKQFIAKIDYINQQIWMELPDGFFEI